MNIFVLDKNPVLAARYHVDKHVVKMVLETAQLLSNAHRIWDGNTEVYKPTHINHPCSKWVAENRNNYLWTYQLFAALSSEYTFRYDKTHKSYSDLSLILCNYPRNLVQYGENNICSDRPLCMPDDCKIENNVVASYRKYYMIGKNKFAKWKNRETPDWWIWTDYPNNN